MPNSLPVFVYGVCVCVCVHVRVCVFCLSFFSGFHTIWGVNTLGNRRAEAAANFFSNIFSLSLSASLSLSEKFKTSQGRKQNGIMRRWELEIGC